MTKHRENKYKTLLKVEVRQAKDLKDTDAVGKSDPYAVVSFDGEEGLPKKDQTHIINGTLNPVWDSKLYFFITDDCKSFKVEVFDKDMMSSDKLGHCNILRKDEEDRNKLTGDTYYLENGKGGTIEIFTHELNLKYGLNEVVTNKAKDIEAFIKAKKRENMALLEVYIHGAKGLKSGLIDKSDPYAQFDFSTDKEGDKAQPKYLRTKTIDNNPSPVWEEVFHFLVPSELRSFKVEVMDEDTVNDDSLGHVSVVCSKLGEHKNHSRLAVSKKGELDMSYFLVPIAPIW